MKRWISPASIRRFTQPAGRWSGSAVALQRVTSCTGFRFCIVTTAIAVGAFAIRSTDAFQSAQFSVLKAEAAQTIADAAASNIPLSPATQIAATKPRLLKPATAVMPPDFDALTGKPPAAAIETADLGLGGASPEVLCKALGKEKGDGSWGQSPLFQGQRECYSKQEGEGYELAKIARGKSGEQVDTIRFTLDLADETSGKKASSDLGRELGLALKTADLQAPESFLESVANLKDDKAVDGPIAFTFEREIASENRFNLIIRKGAAEGDGQLVKARPDLR